MFGTGKSVKLSAYVKKGHFSTKPTFLGDDKMMMSTCPIPAKFSKFSSMESVKNKKVIMFTKKTIAFRYLIWRRWNFNSASSAEMKYGDHYPLAIYLYMVYEQHCGRRIPRRVSGLSSFDNAGTEEYQDSDESISQFVSAHALSFAIHFCLSVLCSFE